MTSPSRPPAARRLLIAILMGFGMHAAAVIAQEPAGAPLATEEWEAAWTRVLGRHVDDAGRVDFARVAADRADLDRVVSFIAAVDPISAPGRFPDRAAKLAYYIDAYNALAMYGVIDAGIPDRFGALGRFRFFYLRTFKMGGRSLSLYGLENDVIRPLGDPRIHFALNCMVVSCPRLPRAALTARNIDAELDTLAREFVAEARNVRAEPAERTVHLSAIFDFYTEDFLAQAPNLIAYVNRYRTQPIPETYSVRFLDYDWTINDRSRLRKIANGRLLKRSQHQPESIEMSARTITSDVVEHYYGKVLRSSDDLQTSACCPSESVAPAVAEILRDVHPEVKERFFGCGSPIPPAVTGLTVLDLGCGSGRDCYVLSKLVGPRGRVIGIDMTDAQLQVARKHLGYHAETFGFANVEFRRGHIEDLQAASIPSDSVDLVISNCVVNLSPDKGRVFHEIFRVLRPGGELYFSDVFADRRMPAEIAGDPVLIGECLGGALYLEDFRRLMARAGCLDARVVTSRRLILSNPEIERKLGPIQFQSATIRAFKLPLEDRCEDFGQVAYYLGSLPGHPHAFDLDDHHHFEKGRPMLVCGNTADMVSGTCYAPHFKVIGDKSVHYGLFACAPQGAASAAAGASAGSSCC